MKRILAIVAVVMVLSGCARLPEVKPITDGGIKKDGGVFYALPSTVITGEVVMSKYTPGPCDKYFSVHYNRPKEWHKSNQTMSTSSVPDLKNIYFVDLFSNGIQNITFSVLYNDKNFITKSTSKAENMTYDVAISALTGLLKVAKAVMFPGSNYLALATYGKSEDEKTKDIEFNQCKLFYNDYRELSKAKITMLSSLQTDNKESLGYRLELLNVIENQLTEPFYTKKDEKIAFAVIPDEGNPDKSIYHIATFDNTWKKSATYGKPTKVNEFESNSLYLVVDRDKAGFSEMIKNVEEGDSKHSYYYRIPGKAKVTLQYGSETIASKGLTISQYGIVSAIPLKPGGKQASADIEFDEVTGAIKSITLGSQIIDPSKLQAAPDMVAGIVKAAYDQKLLDLKRQHAILEEEAGIADIEKRNAAGQ